MLNKLLKLASFIESKYIKTAQYLSKDEKILIDREVNAIENISVRFLLKKYVKQLYVDKNSFTLDLSEAKKAVSEIDKILEIKTVEGHFEELYKILRNCLIDPNVDTTEENKIKIKNNNEEYLQLIKKALTSPLFYNLYIKMKRFTDELKNGEENTARIQAPKDPEEKEKFNEEIEERKRKIETNVIINSIKRAPDTKTAIKNILFYSILNIKMKKNIRKNQSPTMEDYIITDEEWKMALIKSRRAIIRLGPSLSEFPNVITNNIISADKRKEFLDFLSSEENINNIRREIARELRYKKYRSDIEANSALQEFKRDY